MELAKITSKGQITIPIAIRKFLGLKDGDKVMFLKEGNKIIMLNASIQALLTTQQEFEGVAEELGVYNEQDVVDMVKEIRAERSDQLKCE